MCTVNWAEESPQESDDENEIEQFSPVNEPIPEPETGTGNTECTLPSKQNPYKERAKRARKPPNFFTAKFASGNDQIPQSLNDLQSRDDWESWREAIAEEFKSLEDNKTWKVVNLLPRDKKAIQSKWVFSIKDDGRYKARLVAKGCSQRPGFDYVETFAPVVKMENVRTILALANEFGSLVHQMDVKTAFLNGDLDEEIFMQLPKDELGCSKVVKLQKKSVWTKTGQQI